MENEKRGKQDGPTIREVYPMLTEQELKEAEANFRRYLEIVAEIHEEKFDTSQNFPSMEERSNVSLKD
jgi:hypothetical protein